MRPKTILVLAVLVAVLGGFIWLFERDLPSTDARRELDKRMLPVDADEVRSLTIEHGGQKAELEATSAAGAARESLQWYLAAPLTARADSAEVSALLRDLTALEKQRTLTDVIPADVGLDDPRVRLAISTDDDEWRLSVGREIPATRDVVVSVDGHGIFVTAGGFVDRTIREPGDWRSRDVIPGPTREIGALRISTARGEVAFERSGNDFRLVEPVADDADQEKVSQLFDEVSDLEIESFLDGETVTEAGLDSPEVMVTVTLESGDEQLVVRLGGPSDDGEERLAALGEQVFTVETDLPALVDIPASEWQSLGWTGLEAFEIDSAHLDTGEQATELRRENGSWLRDGQEISYSAASDFLDAITGVRGQRLAGRDRISGEESPVWTLELTAGDRQELLTVLESADGVTWASRQGRDYLLELGTQTVADLAAVINELSAMPAEADSEGEAEQIDS